MKRYLLWLTPLFVLTLISLACALPSLPGIPSSTATPTVTALPTLEPTNEPTATPTPIPPTAVPPAEAPLLSIKSFHNKSDSPSYEIDVEYPYMQGESAVVAPFNQAVSAFIDHGVSAFKDDMAQAGDVPVHDAHSSYQIQYTTPLVSDKMISVLFQVHFYYAGAAHPNSYYTAFNYDLTQHKMIELNELFLPGSDYLTTLSNYCTGQLQVTLGDAFFAEGVTPHAENFKTWNLFLDGLEFTFDPYQVGPYAYGVQKVLIPFTELKSITAPDGLLNQFK